MAHLLFIKKLNLLQMKEYLNKKKFIQEQKMKRHFKKEEIMLATSFLKMWTNLVDSLGFWLYRPPEILRQILDISISNMNCHIISAERHLNFTSTYLATGWTAIPRGREMSSLMIISRCFPLKSLPSMTDFLKRVEYRRACYNNFTL